MPTGIMPTGRYSMRKMLLGSYFQHEMGAWLFRVRRSIGRTGMMWVLGVMLLTARASSLSAAPGPPDVEYHITGGGAGAAGGRAITGDSEGGDGLRSAICETGKTMLKMLCELSSGAGQQTSSSATDLF